MYKFNTCFHIHQVSGLSMWTYGIQNPIMMKSELGIQNDVKRARISESVCREIVSINVRVRVRVLVRVRVRVRVCVRVCT